MSKATVASGGSMHHPVAARALAYFDELFPEDAVCLSRGVDRSMFGKATGNQPMTSEALLADIERFDGFGSKTLKWTQADIPYFVNEFWTSGQRKAHAIHEVSYRACFKPQLPEFFISRLTAADEGVYDPFTGRGTTPVQAALMGRRPLANDINPLSVLLTRPRLAPPTLHDVARQLSTIDWDREIDVRDDLLAFYHPVTLRHLCILREWLFQKAPISDHSPDPAVDWIRMVAINRLTGHSSGFFSVYTLPPNQAVSVEAQIKINQKRCQTPSQRDVSQVILKKSKSLLSDGRPHRHPPAILNVGPASCATSIPDASAALVVTSPPFLDVVQYADDNWLRCWFAGIDVSEVNIAIHRTERAWQNMVRDVLVDQARVVRPGGHVAFEVGEVRGGKVLLEKLVWEAAAGLPFRRLAVMVNQQEFTKTANCWGVTNNKSGTNTNRIVLLRRE
jgi:hypothetical protein